MPRGKTRAKVRALRHEMVKDTFDRLKLCGFSDAEVMQLIAQAADCQPEAVRRWLRGYSIPMGGSLPALVELNTEIHDGVPNYEVEVLERPGSPSSYELRRIRKVNPVFPEHKHQIHMPKKRVKPTPVVAKQTFDGFSFALGCVVGFIGGGAAIAWTLTSSIT